MNSVASQIEVRSVRRWLRGIKNRTRDPSRFRRAAAVIETAVMLPIIIVLLFTSLELANGIFLKQAVTIAAYEGARSATRSGGTNENATTRISDVLTARAITNYTASISPMVTSNTPRGTAVTVTVTADASSYTLNPLRLLHNRRFEKRVNMVRL